VWWWWWWGGGVTHDVNQAQVQRGRRESSGALVDLRANGDDWRAARRVKCLEQKTHDTRDLGSVCVCVCVCVCSVCV
jgi:hypothetical protein